MRLNHFILFVDKQIFHVMIETISLEDAGESLQSHKTRITNNQFAVMVDFMTLNPELIRRNFTGKFTKEHYVQKWEELTALLNADFTGARKDNHSWRKCWRDRKSHLKIKAEKRDACILEGTDPSPYQLTDLEERLLQLIKENEPDNTKYIKYLKEDKKPSNHLKVKNSQQDVKNVNIQQKIKDNVNQILGILNKQKGTQNINQEGNNPDSQLGTMNNIPNGILPTSYVLLSADTQSVPLRLHTVTPSLTLEPSNNILMQVESLSDSSVRNDSIPNPLETIVFSDGSCIIKGFKSKLSNKDGIQDSEKMNNSEKVDDDTQDSTTEEINSNSSVSKTTKRSVSNDDENITGSELNEELINGSSDEDSVEKPPRKKVRFTNHAESLCLREDKGELVKVIEKQNHILEGMAKTLARIEKSLGERSAEEAKRKNSMLVKISDNLEQLGESLRTVSKSLKSVGEQ